MYVFHYTVFPAVQWQRGPEPKSIVLYRSVAVSNELRLSGTQEVSFHGRKEDYCCDNRDPDEMVKACDPVQLPREG